MSKIDTSTWKEFPLEELFEVTTTKSQNRNAIAFDDDGIYDFIGRSSVNYGIQGHLNRQEYDPNPASVFSLVQVGESVCLYRENEWYASQNVFMLKPKDERICVAHSFFEALINKQLSVYKTAYEYPCLDDVKKMKILLPYKETEEIDFEYMENYISELEAERISELEAFLAVTGLDDYELTEEDKKVLSLSRNARFEENGSVQDVIKDKIKFGEFQIGKLFKKLPLKNKPNFNKKVDISLEKTTTFDLPLVNAKNGNNGIMYYGNSSEYESDVMTIGIVNDGAVSTGNVNPHPEATGVLYNAYLIKPYYEHLNREILEYLSCALEKCIKKRFGYDNKATWEKVNELYVSLPITYNGDPNYDYMEKYIRAIEKQTIAKIYEGRGKVIEKTKEIVFAD